MLSWPYCVWLVARHNHQNREHLDNRAAHFKATASRERAEAWAPGSLQRPHPQGPNFLTDLAPSRPIPPHSAIHREACSI